MDTKLVLLELVGEPREGVGEPRERVDEPRAVLVRAGLVEQVGCYVFFADVYLV